MILADRGRDLGVGPAGGDHLLEDPDVARFEVRVEEVAGALPLDPERLRPGEHRALALEQPLVLGVEDGQDELLLAAEVVVDLAERDLGGLGDRAGREVGVAVGEQASPGRPRGSRARVSAVARSRRSARVAGAARQCRPPSAEHTTRRLTPATA